MSVRRAVLFGPDFPGRLLPWLVAVHVCIAVLATACGASHHAAAQDARRLLAAAMTIHLPASAAPEIDAARLQTALALVRETPGVATATVVPEGQLRALLAPWLGGASDIGEAPDLSAVRLPTLIDVVLEPGADVDQAALAVRLAGVQPGVVVDAHAPAQRDGAPWRRLVAVAGLDLLLIGLTAAAAAAAAGMALVVRREAAGLLHLLGADDRRIAAPLVRRTAWRSGLGAMLGTAGAAALWIGPLHVGFGGAVDLASGSGAAPDLSVGALIVTAVVPVLTVLAAVLAAQRALLRRLAEDG